MAAHLEHDEARLVSKHRALATLPLTTLSWLSLRDHFIATVGPHAGRGQRLGPLLVLADATFAPQSRFPLHDHADMEILSIVLDGELSHHGDQQHGARLARREAQLISARDGILHAEGNDTDTPTRMLQLWFEPTTRGGKPAYHCRDIPRGRGLIAGDEVVPLRCDAKVHWLDLEQGDLVDLAVAPGRVGYLVALDAPLRAGETRMSTGEGLEVRGGQFALSSEGPASALWLDLRVS
jgi:hypothetical protein